MEDLFYRLEGNLLYEDVRAFTRMGCWESLILGVGCAYDHYYFAPALVEVCACVCERVQLPLARLCACSRAFVHRIRISRPLCRRVFVVEKDTERAVGVEREGERERERVGEREGGRECV